MLSLNMNPPLQFELVNNIIMGKSVVGRQFSECKEKLNCLEFYLEKQILLSCLGLKIYFSILCLKYEQGI